MRTKNGVAQVRLFSKVVTPVRDSFRSCALLSAILLSTAAEAGSKPESMRTFLAKDYPTESFTVTTQNLFFSGAEVNVIQVKSKSPYKTPACRAWVRVTDAHKRIISNLYYNDIDAVGYYFGIFTPKLRVADYFPILKFGDYDGQLLLIDRDLRITKLKGGPLFTTKDRRYLVIQWSSDESYLTVFDLKNGRIIYQSETPYVQQWYEKDGKYFFSESEWLGHSGIPTAKPGVAYWLDFEHEKLVKQTPAPDFRSALKVDYEFPGSHVENCGSE